MSSVGVAKFISIVGLHFPRPKFDDDDTMGAAWTASMIKTLGGYDDDVLARAAQHILGTRNPKKDGKFFPVPSECAVACDHFARMKASTSTTPMLKGPNPNEWSDERIELAFDLMKSPIGKQAVREGWLLGLYDFCRRNMRVPTDGEIRRCRDAARAFNEAYDLCVRGEAGDQSAALARLGASMKAKAQEYAEKVA